jgi:hypothetical protein
MTRTALILSALVVFVCLSPLASAQELPQTDTHWFETPRNFTAGFNVGMVFPTSHKLQDVYGTKGDAIYLLQGGWRMVNELELHAEGAYYFFEGHGVTYDDAGDVKKTGEKYKLHVTPAELGLVYRFNFYLDQPVVPYVGAHGLMTYWIEERLDSGDKNRGLIYGWSGQGGLMFLLDKIEPKASGRLESDWGINNTYFFYEYKYSEINDFGQDKNKTLDLTNNAHTLGVLFQF